RAPGNRPGCGAAPRRARAAAAPRAAPGPARPPAGSLRHTPCPGDTPPFRTRPPRRPPPPARSPPRDPPVRRPRPPRPRSWGTRLAVGLAEVGQKARPPQQTGVVAAGRERPLLGADAHPKDNGVGERIADGGEERSVQERNGGDLEHHPGVVWVAHVTVDAGAHRLLAGQRDHPHGPAFAERPDRRIPQRLAGNSDGQGHEGDARMEGSVEDEDLDRHRDEPAAVQRCHGSNVARRVLDRAPGEQAALVAPAEPELVHALSDEQRERDGEDVLAGHAARSWLEGSSQRSSTSSAQKPGPMASNMPQVPARGRGSSRLRSSTISTDALDRLPTLARLSRVTSRARGPSASASMTPSITAGPPGWTIHVPTSAGDRSRSANSARTAGASSERASCGTPLPKTILKPLSTMSHPITRSVFGKNTLRVSTTRGPDARASGCSSPTSSAAAAPSPNSAAAITLATESSCCCRVSEQSSTLNSSAAERGEPRRYSLSRATPAAPATQPRPNSGRRLVLARNARRFISRASMDGTASPVTVVNARRSPSPGSSWTGSSKRPIAVDPRRTALSVQVALRSANEGRRAYPPFGCTRCRPRTCTDSNSRLSLTSSNRRSPQNGPRKASSSCGCG